MNQDIQDIEVIDVQSHDVTECNAPITQVQCTDYTVDQLAELLEVKRRQVFNLIKTVKQAWHWEPETAFNPSTGKYSQRCLNELRQLQELGSSAYTQSVATKNQKPVIPTTKTSSSLAIPQRQTEILETRLATLQGNLAAQNLSIQDRIALARQQINSDTSRTQQNQSILTDIRKQQAIADGVQEALELFRVKEEALNATLEQLTIEKLGGV
jgi:predicted DNA-binding protein YlxM (UPF0122 family)